MTDDQIADSLQAKQEIKGGSMGDPIGAARLGQIAVAVKRNYTEGRAFEYMVAIT